MKLYFPTFFYPSYETEINKKLRQPETLALANKDYKELWKLKRHAEKVAASIHELEAFASNEETVKALNKYITEAFDHVLAGGKLNLTQHIHPLQNTMFRLKDELSNSACWDVTFSCLNMMSNSFIMGISGAGSILFTAAVLTGPASALLLSMGMAVLSTSLAILAAYSLYVDGRFVVDQQIGEIEEGINFLCEFQPKYMPEPTTGNHSACVYVNGQF